MTSTIANQIRRTLTSLLALTLLSAPLVSVSEQQAVEEAGSGSTLHPLLDDMRPLVEMPENVRKILQGDMLDHLAALNEINRHLADGNLPAAAEVAESGMGRNLLEKYQDVEMRPGRYMPRDMRKIGWELHDAATEFAWVARRGDMKKTLKARRLTTTALGYQIRDIHHAECASRGRFEMKDERFSHVSRQNLPECR